MKNNFVKYKDLLTVKDYDRISNKEEFVFLPLEDELLIGRYQEKCNMSQYGKQIPIRKSVYYKLKEVAKKLKIKRKPKIKPKAAKNNVSWNRHQQLYYFCGSL